MDGGQGHSASSGQDQSKSAARASGYYACFGRYEGSQHAPYPRHAFLIGHERERAHLLDLLYMKSGLGSYLVTGARGVGKTSFVRHCIDTYVKDVYERHSKSMVGRAIPDRVAFVVTFGIAFLTYFIAGSVAAHLLITLQPIVPASTHALLERNVARLIVAGACLALCSAPALLAWHDRRFALGFSMFPSAAPRELKTPSEPRPSALVDICTQALPFVSALVLSVAIPPPLLALGILASLSFACWSSKHVDGVTPGSIDKLAVLAKTARGIALVRLILCWILFLTACLPLAALVTSSQVPQEPSLAWLQIFDWFTGGTLHHQVMQQPHAVAVLQLVDAAIWSMIVACLIRLEQRRLLQPARRILYEPAFTKIDHKAGEPSYERGVYEYFRLHHWLATCAQRTLFHRVFASWMPVVRVPVNLGLDDLGHRHVVESMLQGLRIAYRSSERALTTSLGLLRIGLRLVVTLVLLAALHRFVDESNGYVNLDGTATVSVLSKRIAVFPNAPELSIVLRPDGSSFSVAEILLPRTLTLFDPTLAIVIWLGLTMLERRAGLWPYWRTERRIRALLEALSARVTVQQDGSRFGTDRIAKLTAPFVARTATTEPRDPRSIEQGFISILESLRKPKLQLFPGLAISLPAPETIFIFDELDKVGTSATLIASATEDERATLGTALNLERERSRKLQALLADLKNILSTSPARFFFVGGRNLHDEWLADGANRSPLLTNIFDAEIYLRSLLTDHVSPLGQNGELSRGVAAYIEEQRRRALKAWQEWSGREGAGSRGTQYETLAPSYSYFSAQAWELKPSFGSLGAADAPWEDFDKRFVEFVAFRSRGIPRQARLLVENFVRPFDRNSLEKETKRPAQHILYFSAIDRYHVELVSELYRATNAAMFNALEQRDDKAVTALFQFADFIARFHRGAFSLQSLERFDELMHVHRDPNTSVLAARLIEGWLGQLLEPTAAGIYAYRFRADWGPELAYLSRVSESELAAVNFTLDESQALKQQLLSLLKSMDEQGGVYEVHAGLGELYDLDGDHLEARHHFRHAVDILDKRLAQEFAENGPNGEGRIRRIFESSAATAITRQMDWGLTRLKLLLQLGVSYERTFDYQRAAREYGNALQVAKRFLQTRGDQVLEAVMSTTQSLVLEPALALGWATTKDPSNLSPGIDVARKAVREMLFENKTRDDLSFWRYLKETQQLLPEARSRLIANLADLAFYSIPQERSPGGKQWRQDMYNTAKAGYEAALEVATNADDHAQQARCQMSLALCSLISHRITPRSSIDPSIVKDVREKIWKAQEAGMQAPSGRGAFSESLALYQFAVELAEELALTDKLSRLVCTDAGDDLELGALVRVPSDDLRKNFVRLLRPKGMRARMLKDALRRAADAGVADETNPEKQLVPETESESTFPIRNRMLTLRSQLIKSGDSREAKLKELQSLWLAFDDRVAFPACRMALATGPLLQQDWNSPLARECKDIWMESRDVARGGKRYFSWLRDRFYLEDGYGSLFARASFALTIGLADVHNAIFEGLEKAHESRAKDAENKTPPTT